MSYESDLDEILIERNRIYLRSLEAPLDGLSAEQVQAINWYQRDCKRAKEECERATPTLKDGYREISRILLTVDPASPQYAQLARTRTQMEAELATQKAGVKSASEELERILRSEAR